MPYVPFRSRAELELLATLAGAYTELELELLLEQHAIRSVEPLLEPQPSSAAVVVDEIATPPARNPFLAGGQLSFFA